ncbi:hypothetical protein D5S18_10325 [Nocardia panacis]|uniref:Uncharacterized protein n=1 Tax=Nocardia panacis TaxID=2340916 RepID=A0A3A4KQ15_9NOCA|nr:hypothetical protein [Nocardia panacis]RJO76662.1 hypothetical protein D5S18_10325 [Nocardia panacis]
MKLRSLLHRRQSEKLPLLPEAELSESTDASLRAVFASREKKKTRAAEERLERLLTPTELDLVREHRL